MAGIDLERLERAAEWLAPAFYGLMVMALTAVFSASAGWGFLLLVLGSCAYVGWVSFEEFVEKRRAGEARSRRERRPEAQPLSVRSRGSSRAADDIVVTATRDRRAVKLRG